MSYASLYFRSDPSGATFKNPYYGHWSLPVAPAIICSIRSSAVATTTEEEEEKKEDEGRETAPLPPPLRRRSLLCFLHMADRELQGMTVGFNEPELGL